jgi:hypothetical protein
MKRSGFADGVILQHIGINITHQTEKNILKKKTLSSLFLLYTSYKNIRSRRFGTVIAKPVLNKK